jgi:hypothetical protein
MMAYADRTQETSASDDPANDLPIASSATLTIKKSSCAMKATAPSTAMIAQLRGFPVSAVGAGPGIAAGQLGALRGMGYSSTNMGCLAHIP